MFSPDKSLAPLETLLHGYCACLHAHEIGETYEGRRFDPCDFSAWLYDQKGWSGALGFANAIEQNCPRVDAAYDRFFDLVEEFRFGEETS